MKPHAPEFAPKNLDAPHVPEPLILPSQWQDLQRTITHSPERRLMKAILDDALYCLQVYGNNPDTRARRLFAEAHAWVFSDEQSWLYSFLSICAFLDIHENYLRRGITAWLQQNDRANTVKYDAAYGKPVNGLPQACGRPPTAIWKQKLRKLEQWRIFYRNRGVIYNLGSYGSEEEAARAVARAKKNTALALQKVLAHREAESACA